jgi:hypothetical protein
MIHLNWARRGMLAALFATLFSVPAVVAGATGASANPACIGKISLLTGSRPHYSIGVIFRNGGTAGLARGDVRWGTETNPIVSFKTPADRSATIAYYDLADRNTYITTHTVDRGGTFAINPCHWGKVTIR